MQSLEGAFGYHENLLSLDIKVDDDDDDDDVELFLWNGLPTKSS